MKPLQFILMKFLFVGVSFPLTALSDTIIIENSSGENIELGIDANDRFLDVLNQIQAYFQQDVLEEENQGQKGSVFPFVSGISARNTQWNLAISHAGLSARAKKEEKQSRDYDAPISKSEKDDIAFIVNTLAYDSLISISSQKSSLKKAGDRIDRIHPLRFLEVVFSSERLKAGIAAIRGQFSWVKDGFFDGIFGSLKEEAGRDNLFRFVSDFAKNVKIDVKRINPTLKRGDWKGFINTLIEEIPRDQDPNRYNM